MTGQLIFDLFNVKNFNPDDFYVSENNFQASELINQWPNWHNNAAIIFGKEKSGKTHLANIWKKIANADLFDLTGSIEVSKISTNKNIVIDNFHRMDEFAEENFLHFYNQIFNNKRSVLFTANPEIFKTIKLNDLRSRLSSFASATIENPDDSLINALIVKFFKDQQITIDPAVLSFVVKRIERNYERMFSFLKKVNELSLENKSKISISFLNKFFTF